MAQKHASQHIPNFNERKNIDAAIIQLAAIVEYSGEAILGKTPQGMITSWNSGAEQLFGYTANEVIGKSISLIFPPDRQQELPEILARITAGETVQHLETTRIKKDGTLIEVSVTISPIRDPTGRIVAASTIAHDISAQKRMVAELATRTRELEDSVEELATRSRELEHSNEELATRSRELKHSNAQLAAIVEYSGEAIIGKTLQGVITIWNSGAEQLFGYSAGEVIGKSISLTFPPDRQQELPEILARITAGETVQHFETVRMKKDGTLIEVSVTVSPIRDPTGRIVAASTIAHDISAQKRMVEELIAVNAALVEANKARDQFLAIMSHELRTPLTSIIGFSEMQLEDIAQAGLSSLQDSQQRILKNAQHLLELINDVLDLSKIEAGRMDVTFMQVDVKKLLTSVVEETHSIALAQHLALSVEVEEGLDALETNELKLHQILLNLVSNALKFTQQGEVTLSARRVASQDKQGERVALAVTDTGIGIPADMHERIFEEFYQADGSYTRKYSGTGLGLAIVRQLTKLLGGTIQLKSAPGQGSTFTVLLPIKAARQRDELPSPRLHLDQRPQSLAAPANREGGDGQTNVVLAVDDNPDVIDLIKAALKHTSYKVVGVTDPSKAMASIQRLHPCAITLDVMMPKLNGWQILHRLKDNPAAASIPVIVLSVLSEPSTGYVLGADDYLIKPFNRDDLISTLDRLVASRRSSFQATNLV